MNMLGAPKYTVNSYPRIADTGMIFYPWRVEGTGAGVGFWTQARAREASIREQYARCHLYPSPSITVLTIGWLMLSEKIGASAKAILAW
jgi:hypothetical protein